MHSPNCCCSNGSVSKQKAAIWTNASDFVEHRETEVNKREANVDDRDAMSKSDQLLRQRGRLVAVIFGLMIAATLSCLGLAGTLAGWHLKVGVLGFFAFVGLAIDYGSRADRPGGSR